MAAWLAALLAASLATSSAASLAARLVGGLVGGLSSLPRWLPRRLPRRLPRGPLGWLPSSGPPFRVLAAQGAHGPRRVSPGCPGRPGHPQAPPSLRGPPRARATAGPGRGRRSALRPPVPYLSPQCLTSALPVPYPVPYLANPMNLHAGRIRCSKSILRPSRRRRTFVYRGRPASKIIGFAR